eukprot:m.865281 g.865281  ORF g.865281 m.865281 type:complete len:110 (-) comp23549_c0_seq8:682-1011(-)
MYSTSVLQSTNVASHGTADAEYDAHRSLRKGACGGVVVWVSLRAHSSESGGVGTSSLATCGAHPCVALQGCRGRNQTTIPRATQRTCNRRYPIHLARSGAELCAVCPSA